MSKKLQERIEELERKVRDLEARPLVFQPVVQPIVINPPQQPAPVYPAFPIYPTITCLTVHADPNAMLFNGRALTS